MALNTLDLVSYGPVIPVIVLDRVADAVPLRPDWYVVRPVRTGICGSDSKQILLDFDGDEIYIAEAPELVGKTLGEALTTWDVMQAHDAGVFNFYKAAPGGVPTQVAFSQDRRWNELDMDRSHGVIRDKAHAFSQDGGLAVLYGNLAERGFVANSNDVHAPKAA